MTAGSAASRRVLARTPVAPLPASSPTRPTGITGRMSAPPETSSPEVCSFRLPQMCGFRLPLTDVIEHHPAGGQSSLTSIRVLKRGHPQLVDATAPPGWLTSIRRFETRDKWDADSRVRASYLQSAAGPGRDDTTDSPRSSRTSNYQECEVDISVPCGDGRNPSPSGEEKSVVVWSRATVSPWSAHENGPQSSPGVDPEISEARVDWRGGGSCARFDPPDSAGARVGSPVRKSGTRPRPRVCFVSPESGHQHDCPVAEGDQLAGAPLGVSALAQSVLG